MVKLLLAALVLWLAWRWLKPARTADERAVTQARAMLGVGLRADADAIRAAHRRLLADAHPDRGGPSELAGRLNAARDLLLRSLER